MINRTEIKKLFLKNYTLEDSLDQLIERMTVKEIEDLIQEDQDLEPERAEVESEDQTKQ